MILLAYAIVSYLTFGTAFSLVMVPYFAFSAEITLDYNERTKVVTFRVLFSLIGSLLASALPMSIISSFQNSKQGYLMMSIAFGILFGIAILCVFFSKKETYRPDVNKEKIGFFKSFSNAFKIRAFRQYVGIFIFGMMAIDIVSMIMAYYTRYFLRADGVLSLFLTVALISQLAMVPFWSFIARKFSKRTAYMAGTLIWAVMGTAIAFVPKTTPIPFILGMIVLISMGMGAVMFMPHAILGDITDVGEFAYGKRQEGSFSGFATFIRKFSSGVGLAVVTGVLGVLGYITPPDNTVNYTLVYQPPAVEGAIRIFISIVPVVLVLIGFWFAFQYKLSRENHNKLIEHLNSIREGRPGTLTPDEELRLRRLLISKKVK
jgi:oligogalacturonide transporter